METVIAKNQKTLTTELAEAISEFNIDAVGNLLLDNGEFQILDEKDETIISNKDGFIFWLKNCFDVYTSVNEDINQLNYTIDQCLHCRVGNPVIIMDNGRFPVFTRNSCDREKIGLMLEFKDEMISDITFCGFFLKTDNPFHFEKECASRYGKTI
jgi:hypothetical protein